LHPLLLAGLPAHSETLHKRGELRQRGKIRGQIGGILLADLAGIEVCMFVGFNGRLGASDPNASMFGSMLGSSDDQAATAD